MRISDNCSSVYAFGDTVFLFSSLTQFLLLIALGTRRSVEFLRWIKFLIRSSLKFFFVKYMDELCPVLSYTTVPKKKLALVVSVSWVTCDTCLKRNYVSVNFKC